MKEKINTTIISLFKQIILALVILILAGCAMPKIPQIIVIDDPLTAQQHNDLGVAYEEKGDYALAGKEYEKAIKKNRDWVIPYLNLGHLYYRQDKLDQAERALREGLRAKGDHPDLLNNLAWVLMEKGQSSRQRPSSTRPSPSKTRRNTGTRAGKSSRE